MVKGAIVQQEDLILKQLKKLKAEVTIWKLIVAFQKHSQLIIDELNKINLSLKATPKEIIALITLGKDTTTFNNEELPLGGSTYNNSLYLIVICL